MLRKYFIWILMVFSGWFFAGLTNQALATDAECIDFGGICKPNACPAANEEPVGNIACTSNMNVCCVVKSAESASEWAAPAASGSGSEEGSGASGSGSGANGPPFTGVGAGNPSGSGSGGVSCPAGTSLEGGTCIPTGVGLSTGAVSTRFGNWFSFPAICFSGPVLCVLATFLSWILTVLGMVTVISFVIAGLQYMFALGDPKSVETAKSHMKWSIVGLIVALSGVIAIIQINSWLGF